MPTALTRLAKRVQALFKTDADDLQLVNRILQGDNIAFDQLASKYTESMYALAYQMTQQSALAEDIVQECFIKMWQHADAWQPHKAKFSTWLHRIVMNRCIDELRSASQRSNQSLDTENLLCSAQSVEQQASEHEQQQHYQQAMQHLAHNQRTALALIYSSGLSNRDAANVMGLKLKAFESLLLRAKQNLQQQINQHYGEPR